MCDHFDKAARQAFQQPSNGAAKANLDLCDAQLADRLILDLPDQIDVIHPYDLVAVNVDNLLVKQVTFQQYGRRRDHQFCRSFRAAQLNLPIRMEQQVAQRYTEKLPVAHLSGMGKYQAADVGAGILCHKQELGDAAAKAALRVTHAGTDK